jgi:hypothetical protein
VLPTEIGFQDAAVKIPGILARVIFENPSAASDFTVWLKETGAQAVGQFKLGLFRGDETSGQQTVNSADRSIMQSYQPITAEDLATIRVAPLGEP